MDAKDILGLPKNALPLPRSKPPKESQRKPDGISREVYALTGGLAPLIPAIESNHLKQRKAQSQSENEKITWQWLPFTNSARKDNLQLYHWVRVVNGVPPTGDYSFAKYNKSVDVIKYTDEEYEKYLTDPDPYNASQEMERKRALNLLLSQTKQQERRDIEVLAQAKRISEARKSIKGSAVVERPAVSDAVSLGPDKVVTDDTVTPINPDVPSSAITNPASEIASVLSSLRMLGVYLRTYALEQMVQAASSSAGLRTIKRVEQTLQDLGVNLKPKVPTKAVCAEHLELRKEILTLLSLQKQLQYKEAEGSSIRDASFAETPGTPPKQALRAADLDRTFTPDSSSIGGDRLGKREQKRKRGGCGLILKGPGRLSEAPSSPAQSKRPRKFKASD
ncbi:SWR1-complex protein 4 isoform X5 [Andrographis paniculata]|uniref:SWR1-complex protein 4 isoform X5 n=1 Tax=Andrographis paniculata TaxID=175694 RepID=UPI0021E6D9F5|nr:SWR1-complex protein 4 isoform X5 [Andrographis paniculata]